jgi:hypothetical protein
MRDAGYLRDVVRDALKVEVPRKIVLLRPQWQLTAEELPDVDQIISGEPPDGALSSLGRTWLAVLNPRLFKTDQVDIDPAGRPVYMSRYSCRILVWALEADWDAAIKVRDRLAAVTRLSLLEWPNLKPGTYGDTGYRLHRNTYAEQFGEPVRLEARGGGRVWASAALAADVDVEETLADGSTRVPIGQAQTVAPSAQAAGPTKPLP